MSKRKSPSWKRREAAIAGWGQRKARHIDGLGKEIQKLYKELDRLHDTIAIDGPSLRRLGYSIGYDDVLADIPGIIEYTQEVLRDARTLKKLIPRLEKFIRKAEELRKLVRPPRERRL